MFSALLKLVTLIFFPCIGNVAVAIRAMQGEKNLVLLTSFFALVFDVFRLFLMYFGLRPIVNAMMLWIF